MVALARRGPAEHRLFFGGNRLLLQVAVVQPPGGLDGDDVRMEKRRAFDGDRVAFEFGHRVDRSLSVADFLLLAAFVFDAIDAQHADDDFHLRRLKFRSQIVDQADERFRIFVLAVAQIVVALEPDQPRDFVAGFFVVGGKLLFQAGERFVDDVNELPVLRADDLLLLSAEPLVDGGLVELLVVDLRTDFARAGRAEIHLQALPARPVLDEQHLFLQGVAHEISKRVFRPDLGAQLTVVLAAAEPRLELVADRVVDNPDIVARHIILPARLEFLKQRRAALVFVFAKEIDGLDLGLAVHVGLPGENEDLHRLAGADGLLRKRRALHGAADACEEKNGSKSCGVELYGHLEVPIGDARNSMLRFKPAKHTFLDNVLWNWDECPAI